MFVALSPRPFNHSALSEESLGVGERFHKYSTFCRHQDRYLFIPYAGQQLLRSCFHGQYKALELLRTTALCCFNDDQGNKSSMQVVLHPDSVLTTKYSVNQNSSTGRLPLDLYSTRAGTCHEA